MTTNGQSKKIIKKNKIIIQKDGKKPLVIEDGKVIEGENDYSKEEIEKIKKENSFDSNGKNAIKSFSFNLNDNDLDMGNLRDQIEKMQSQMQKMMPNSSENEVSPRISKPSKSEKEDLTNEMKEAKDEMIKAKKALEEAQKTLQKTKTEMKTHRI
jgi:septation ring formation regulator EzrA